MSAASNFIILPKQRDEIVKLKLNLNAGKALEAKDKAFIYAKALKSNLIQVISSYSNNISLEKVKILMFLNLELAKKVRYFIFESQSLFPNSSYLLRLFDSVIATLEDLLSCNLSAEDFANVLYGVFELLDDLNNTFTDD